jgi:hypothetical protein
MIQKYFSYIAIGLLSIIIIQGFLNGNDHNYELYEDKINEYKKEKIENLKQIDSLNRSYENIEKHISIDSLNIWTSDRITRDSLRAILNPR